MVSLEGLHVQACTHTHICPVAGLHHSVGSFNIIGQQCNEGLKASTSSLTQGKLLSRSQEQNELRQFLLTWSCACASEVVLEGLPFRWGVADLGELLIESIHASLRITATTQNCRRY